jgi:3-dehydroquinate synthetase
MCLITEKATANGVGDTSMLDSLVACLKNYELPTTVPVPLKDLLPFCYNDKKRESNSLNIVLCEEIGRAVVKKIAIDELNTFMGV